MFAALFDKGKFKQNHSMEKENSICTRDWGRDWKSYSPMVEFLGLQKHENGKTMFPNACLSWLDFFLALLLYNLQSLCTSLRLLISVTEGHKIKFPNISAINTLHFFSGRLSWENNLAP